MLMTPASAIPDGTVPSARGESEKSARPSTVAADCSELANLCVKLSKVCCKRLAISARAKNAKGSARRNLTFDVGLQLLTLSICDLKGSLTFLCHA